MRTDTFFRSGNKVLISAVAIAGLLGCLGLLWIFWGQCVERRRRSDWREYVSDISSKVDVEELQSICVRLLDKCNERDFDTDALPESVREVDKNIPRVTFAYQDDSPKDRVVDIWWRLSGGFKGIMVGTTTLDTKKISQLSRNPYTLNIKSNVVLYCDFETNP